MDSSRAHPIAQAVLTILHRLLGTGLCLVGRITSGEAGSAGAQTLVLHDLLDRGDHGLQRGAEIPLADTLAAIVERTRASVVSGRDLTIEAPFERGLGARAALVVPIAMRDGAVVGALYALDRSARTFSAQDVELATDLARVVATELEEGLQLDRVVELERARLAGLLARGLAHDFGNVVSSALANVRSLSRILEGNAHVREPLEEITASLEAGRELIARLRDVGRSDTGKRHRGLDPTAIASKVVAIARAVFTADHAGEMPGAGKWIALRLVPPDDPLEIRGDEHALEQALLNLVLNARDAVGTRGGKVTVRVLAERLTRNDLDHPWHTPGEWVVLAVDDDGPGIPAQERGRVFEPGYTTKGERGTGLGLFLVATTATAHGGGVLVERSPEGGARVSICLPATSRAASQQLPSSSKRDLVLVADDERGLRRACARELSAAGLAVAEAASRAAALEIVEADPKRIVAAIVDRDLGDGSGEDVARRIRALNPRALVIETSGASDLLNDAGEAVLEKPFDLQALVERIVAVTKRR